MALLNYSPPTDPYLDIVYRDEDLLVLNKPSGLLSVPGKAPEHQDSLMLRVQRVYPTATIVHRLDMATSGLMLMALNKDSHRHISRQFQDRKTHKTYMARIYAAPEAQQGTIELPLICDWPNRPKQKVDFALGKASSTHWQIIDRHSDHCRVKLTPITGRSHQLRVHMLHLGCPILGDRLYAHEAALAMAPRLQLHAQDLQIQHPVTERVIQFHAPAHFR